MVSSTIDAESPTDDPIQAGEVDRVDNNIDCDSRANMICDDVSSSKIENEKTSECHRNKMSVSKRKESGDSNNLKECTVLLNNNCPVGRNANSGENKVVESSIKPVPPPTSDHSSEIDEPKDVVPIESNNTTDDVTKTNPPRIQTPDHDKLEVQVEVSEQSETENISLDHELTIDDSSQQQEVGKIMDKDTSNMPTVSVSLTNCDEFDDEVIIIDDDEDLQDATSKQSETSSSSQKEKKIIKYKRDFEFFNSLPQSEFAAIKEMIPKAGSFSTRTSTLACLACCVACVPPQNPPKRHPILGVCVCRKCFFHFINTKWKYEVGANEDYCLLCLEGGDMFMCDSCTYSFCGKCLRKVLGRSEYKNLTSSESDEKWECLVCNPKALLKHRASYYAYHLNVIANVKDANLKKLPQVSPFKKHLIKTRHIPSPLLHTSTYAQRQRLKITGGPQKEPNISKPKRQSHSVNLTTYQPSQFPKAVQDDCIRQYELCSEVADSIQRSTSAQLSHAISENKINPSHHISYILNLCKVAKQKLSNIEFHCQQRQKQLGTETMTHKRKSAIARRPANKRKHQIPTSSTSSLKKLSSELIESSLNHHQHSIFFNNNGGALEVKKISGEEDISNVSPQFEEGETGCLNLNDPTPSSDFLTISQSDVMEIGDEPPNSGNEFFDPLNMLEVEMET